MFVGHAFIAFALVGLAARHLWGDPRRALAAAALAGVFATIPDIDIVYAFAGVLSAQADGPISLASSFWAASSLVHRAVTHSVVVAAIVATAATAWVSDGRTRAVAVGLLAGLVAVAGVVSGPLGSAVMGLFGVSALAVATVAARRTALSPAQTFGVAFAGLASHPFGDLFTGRPPALLYPFDATVLSSRVALSADPTVHLLGAFAFELTCIWLGVGVLLSLSDVSPSVTPRAALGVGYAASVLLIPAPTLDFSYPFVFSVLAVGSLGVFPHVRLDANADGGIRINWVSERVPANVSALAFERPAATTAVLTGLSAVTVAWTAYTVAYLASDVSVRTGLPLVG